MKIMTKAIDKNRLQRRIILRALYQFVCGDTTKWACLRQISENENIVGDAFKRAYYYLMNECLISPYGAGFMSFITHKGIKKVEEDGGDDIILNKF